MQPLVPKRYVTETLLPRVRNLEEIECMPSMTGFLPIPVTRRDEPNIGSRSNRDSQSPSSSRTSDYPIFALQSALQASTRKCGCPEKRGAIRPSFTKPWEDEAFYW